MSNNLIKFQDFENWQSEEVEQFRLSNYSYCKDYDFADWARELFVRLGYYRPDNDISIIQHFHLLMNLYVKNTELFNCFYTLEDLARLSHLVGNVEPIALTYELTCKCCNNKGLDLEDTSKEDLSSSSIVAVIDIEAPDELLIDELLLKVKEARKKRGMKPRSSVSLDGKPFTIAEVRRWHSLGVLPYLDLLEWCKSRNVKISNQCIGVVIFSDPYQTYERKVQRLKRTVDELMATKRLNNLFFQGLNSKDNK